MYFAEMPTNKAPLVSYALSTKLQSPLRGWHKEKAPKIQHIKASVLEPFITRTPLSDKILTGRLKSCWDARFLQLLAAINSTSSRLRIELLCHEPKQLDSQIVEGKFVRIIEEGPINQFVGESGEIQEMLNRIALSHPKADFFDGGWNIKVWCREMAEVKALQQLLVWLQIREDYGCYIGIQAIIEEEGCMNAVEWAINLLGLNEATEKRLRKVISGEVGEFQSPFLKKPKYHCPRVRKQEKQESTHPKRKQRRREHEEDLNNNSSSSTFTALEPRLPVCHDYSTLAAEPCPKPNYLWPASEHTYSSSYIPEAYIRNSFDQALANWPQASGENRLNDVGIL